MKLMQRMEAVAAVRHLSPRTSDCYQAWVRRFLQFHRDGQRWRHPHELRGADVGTFLTHLAVDRRLSASSQNQAMNAIVFLYRDVFANGLPQDHLGPIDAMRATRPRKVPTVLSQREVQRLIDAIQPGSMHRAMTEVLYGCGLRLMECCTLRVRDVDFDRRQIVVRGGKGDKDRVVAPNAQGRVQEFGVGRSAFGFRAEGEPTLRMSRESICATR